MKIIDKHPLIIIILLYALGNIFLFLNNGWYWDDWCLSTPEGLRDISIGIGAPFMIPIHLFLINLTSHPALIYHISTGIIEIFVILFFLNLFY